MKFGQPQLFCEPLHEVTWDRMFWLWLLLTFPYKQAQLLCGGLCLHKAGGGAAGPAVSRKNGKCLQTSQTSCTVWIPWLHCNIALRRFIGLTYICWVQASVLMNERAKTDPRPVRRNYFSLRGERSSHQECYFCTWVTASHMKSELLPCQHLQLVTKLLGRQKEWDTNGANFRVRLCFVDASPLETPHAATTKSWMAADPIWFRLLAWIDASYIEARNEEMQRRGFFVAIIIEFDKQ